MDASIVGTNAFDASTAARSSGTFGSSTFGSSTFASTAASNNVAIITFGTTRAVQGGLVDKALASTAFDAGAVRLAAVAEKRGRPFRGGGCSCGESPPEVQGDHGDAAVVATVSISNRRWQF